MYAVFQSKTDRRIMVVEPIMYKFTLEDFCCGKVLTPDNDNSFRGGSRGKGGKIKYARR